MIAAILGGATLQWPLGRLSDSFDRRKLVTVAAFSAAALAVMAMFASTVSLAALAAAAFFYAGISLPMYSLCIAHTNDFLKADQLVAASGTLILLYGTGAIGGPLVDGVLMGWLGSGAYWGYLAAAYGALGLFAVYRMTRRRVLPREEKGRFVAVPENATPTVTSSTPDLLT